MYICVYVCVYVSMYICGTPLRTQSGTTQCSTTIIPVPLHNPSFHALYVEYPLPSLKHYIKPPAVSTN